MSLISVSQSNFQTMSNNKRLQGAQTQVTDSVQVVDQRFMVLQQQIMAVQQKVGDNAEVIVGVTTGFAKFSDTWRLCRVS